MTETTTAQKMLRIIIAHTSFFYNFLDGRRERFKIFDVWLVTELHIVAEINTNT